MNLNLNTRSRNIHSRKTKVIDTSRDIFTTEKYVISNEEEEFLSDENEWGLPEHTDQQRFEIYQFENNRKPVNFKRFLRRNV